MAIADSWAAKTMKCGNDRDVLGGVADTISGTTFGGRSGHPAKVLAVGVAASVVFVAASIGYGIKERLCRDE